MLHPRFALRLFLAILAPCSIAYSAVQESPVSLVRSGVTIVVSPLVEAPAEAVADRCMTHLSAIRTRFEAENAGASPNIQDPSQSQPFDKRATIRVFATHEERALQVGRESSFGVDADALIADVVMEPGVTRQCGRAEALLYLVGRLGPTPSQWLSDGAPYALADDDAVKDYRATAAWIEEAGESTALADLVDNERYERRSSLVQTALSAVLAELVLEVGGADELSRLWSGASIDVDHYGPLYRDRLEELAEQHHHWMVQRRAKRAEARTRTQHRGVCFAHEGYGVRDGYISEMAERSMRRAHTTGARALSLTPFGFYRDPNQPEIRWPRRTGSSTGRESDESILVASANARALQMTTMLKPHLWGHGWCGTIQMRTEGDWDAWFANYGEFLVHYALLAERAEIDWLSIGCELVKTTKNNSDRWRGLVSRARGLFAGGLCYSANWGEEMEQIGFADDLDAVGVDFYFPLSDKENPTDEELLEGATLALEKTAALRIKYDRPILLTEIGYPSRGAPWKDPFETTRGGTEFAELQARCLTAFANAFHAQSAVDGFYVWKWPTFDDWSDRQRIDYWPAGSASVEALERAFRH